MSYYEKNKENLAVIGKYSDTIQNSWTWEHLTENEKNNFKQFIRSERIMKTLKYSFNHKWEILSNLYSMYLIALGYECDTWENRNVD